MVFLKKWQYLKLKLKLNTGNSHNDIICVLFFYIKKKEVLLSKKRLYKNIAVLKIMCMFIGIKNSVLNYRY